ncbi:WXG100 family type VII secretion target [Antribacter gilvus]|uniref:WXG100 family type VII secretion target n=1 Tax=Antribacter gilvus TaxID=2304675 RepID=UPI000F769A4F|nr:WXG100 family type VII secretion target [Antribacter gilvus]
MANINVTYADMQDAAKRITAGQAEMETKLRELKNLVDQLVNGGYVTDKSSVAFNSAYGEFNTGATQCIGGLEGISQYLDAAAEALRGTDEELAKALNK